MGTCETKATHSDLGILMHILAESSILRNYSGILRHIQNPVQPWYIKNPRTFKTIGIFRTLSKIKVESFCENS